MARPNGQVVMSLAARTELVLRALCVPGLCLLSRLFGPRLQQLPTICLWKRLTGHECFGCGMGRALIAAFSGDFPAALHYHRLVFVAVGCLGAIWIGAIGQIAQWRNGWRS